MPTDPTKVSELYVFQALWQILLHELNPPIDADRVMFFNQEWKIPPDEGMFIYLECLPAKIISNVSKQAWDPVSGTMQETQDLTLLERIVIGVYSKNMEAFKRKEEVVMAIASNFSQQIQEQNSIKINRIAPIEDLKSLEGGSLLYRYDIPITLFTWSHKISAIPYFEGMNVEVDVNDGTPDLNKEFAQPTTDPTQGG